MSEAAARDRRWLEAAARQATPLLGTTGGRPTVGAILVDPASSQVLARAVTPRGGAGDAAGLCLAEAGAAARGATLYLTLPPVFSSPEMQAIAAGAIGRLVVGVRTANLGEASGALAAPGRQAPRVEFVETPACLRLHEGVLSIRRRQRPFVVAQLALSADGKVAGPGGGHAGLLGDAAERWSAVQRARGDALLTGWRTALGEASVAPSTAMPLREVRPRIVLAGLKAVQPSAGPLGDPDARDLLVVATPEKKLALPPGVEIVRVKGAKGRPDLPLALAALATRSVQTVYVEAGPTLVDALLSAGLIDRFHLLQAEVSLGPDGVPAVPKGTVQQRLMGAGFSLVDHRVLGVDNLRTFERLA